MEAAGRCAKLLAVTICVTLSANALAGAMGSRPLTATELVDAGLAAGAAHHWEAALACFNLATRRDPGLASAWANHGTALLNLGRPTEAIASYERSRMLNPRDPYVHCSLASACSALNRPEEAFRHADDALAIDPEFAPAMANKANALAALGRPEEAQPLFARAFALQPTLREHFPGRLPPPVDHLLLEVGDLDRSIAFYRDRLGLTVKRRDGSFAMLESDTIGIYLWTERWPWSPAAPPGGRSPGGMYPHLTVPDVRGLIARLRSAGDRIIAEPKNFSYGTEAFVADPDGFVWALLSPQ